MRVNTTKGLSPDHPLFQSDPESASAIPVIVPETVEEAAPQQQQQQQQPPEMPYTEVGTAVGVDRKVELVQIAPKIVLTDEWRARIKQHFGPAAKKVTRMGYDFVFMPLTYQIWQDAIGNWENEKFAQGVTITIEERNRRIVDSSVIFPNINAPFRQPAEFIAYYNQLPAGIEPELADLIQHHSGFYVDRYATEFDISLDTIYPEEVEKFPRPSKEDAKAIAESVGLPCRLVSFFGDWYIVRAMTTQERQHTMKMIAQDPNGDHENRKIQECIVYGPQKLLSQSLAGLPAFLLSNIKLASGIQNDQGQILSATVEDL